GVPGDLPAEAGRVREVAGVAAPLTLRGRADVRRPGTASLLQHGVDLLAVGDVVGQGDRDVALAAADRPDLGLEAGLGPQGQHQPFADLDHRHVAGDVHRLGPA